MQLSSAIEIGRALPGEIQQLPGIELAAALLFVPDHLSPEAAKVGLPMSFFEEARAAGRLWVARAASRPEVVGFAAAILLDGSAHLHEMDVLPRYGRQGIGRRLLQHVATWARSEGHSSLTLVTFRDVPWNAPFYRTAGFVEIPEERIGPQLRALMREEERRGLDPQKRVGMSLALDGLAR